MSWRETLGVTPSAETSDVHNPQNMQNRAQPPNCADTADSAYMDSEQGGSKLLEDLPDACRGLDIAPTEVVEALAAEDIEDWRGGEINGETLAAFAQSLVQRQQMDQGKRPDHYTEQATCKHCGPIWLWFSGAVLGCPWCWNRVAGRPIPRPTTVCCGDCVHFQRIDHPHLGHCPKAAPGGAITGLWDMDQHRCARWLPLAKQTGGETRGD